MTWFEVFNTRISHIYFIYGLAFFALGLAVALEIGRAQPTRFSRAMRPLAFFGLVHGIHEWIKMFTVVGEQVSGFQSPSWLLLARLILLALSFLSLVAFGVRILLSHRHLRCPDLWIGLAMLLLYGLGVAWLGWWLGWQQALWFAAADALARYTLAVPGTVLASWALLAQRRALLRQNQLAFANDLLWAALAFFLYGVVGQVFVDPNPLLLSDVFNAAAFQNWLGVPIQLFRATMAVMIAVFIIGGLRSFEFNRQQALIAAQERVQEEISRRDALRQEFLHRIVKTQEEERTRIARELHDELGQVLTGLSIGLRGAQTSVDRVDLLREQLIQLEKMAVQALGNMRRLVNELRPALLDDVGLPAALRHHVENFADLTGIEASLTIYKDPMRLPGELETILFRITQEALTNIARHAQATRASVDLRCDNGWAILKIEDDGLGFDPTLVGGGDGNVGWGLLGIQERVRLADGDIQIKSATANGTQLTVKIPLNTAGMDNDSSQVDVG